MSTNVNKLYYPFDQPVNLDKGASRYLWEQNVVVGEYGSGYLKR
jgi:hypothetical protein